MPKTAVIILNWNGAKMMRQFLPSVISNSAEATIVVADNGSTDDSLEMLSKEFPSVRQVVLNKNYGFAEGYNKAIAEVEAEYIVLLNSDVEVTEGWLKPLTEYMDAHPEAAACQPKLRAFYDKKSFEYAGASGGFIDCFGYPFCRGRIFSAIEEDKGQYDTIEEIHWATGAAMFVRREEYMNAGGLDGRFFAHNEEIDLCWRLRLFGKKIVCVPSSVVYHLGGGTLPQGNPRKTYLNFRNNLTMLYKNLPDKTLKKVMLWRFFLDYLAAFQSLATLKLGDVKAIYKARCDFSKLKNDYKSIREEIQQKAVCKEQITVPYSILFKFYIKRIKSFENLSNG